MTSKREKLNHTQLRVIRAVYKACRIDPGGWAEARQIGDYCFPSSMVDKYGGRLVAPTLTVLRGWEKPLVEARDNGYGKEYRLTPAGKRARQDARGHV